MLFDMITDSLPFASLDLAALAFFVIGWALFSQAAQGRIVSRPTLTSAMDKQREQWMRTMARRELRMVDTGILGGLQQGTAFFASSSLLAIGGCFALLGSSDRILVVLEDLPSAGAMDRHVFEAKVFGLIALFSYAFFKFAWSYRLFNYFSILLGAVPVYTEGQPVAEGTEEAIRRAGRMNLLAGRHFNTGLTAIFFSIGYLGWFVGPVVFFATTLFVLAVLVRRQFFSAARRCLLQ